MEEIKESKSNPYSEGDEKVKEIFSKYLPNFHNHKFELFFKINADNTTAHFGYKNKGENVYLTKIELNEKRLVLKKRFEDYMKKCIKNFK